MENGHISSHYRHDHLTENFLFVWIDCNTNNHTQESIALLRDIVGTLNLFTDPDQCVSFIIEMANKKIFMLISEEYVQQLIPLIQEISQLDSIYILGNDKLMHDECSKRYKKVKGVYEDIITVCNLLKQDIDRYNRDLTPISIISSSFAANSDELDSSFMYSQLLKEIFLDTPCNDKEEKRAFTDYCRVQDVYKIATTMINEFEEKYDDQSSIWWYTRNCFIYEMLNKALRTQEIEIILKMSFFLRNLHCQIEQLYLKQDHMDHLTVFRGQGVSNIDFEKIKNNIGGLLSFNNFLSTSTDDQVAYMFADSARQNLDSIGIIFQIETNTSSSSTAFASVREFSFLHEEQEILFSINSVFRIAETKKIDDRLWQTNLTLTSDNDPLLKDLTECMRN